MSNSKKVESLVNGFGCQKMDEQVECWRSLFIPETDKTYKFLRSHSVSSRFRHTPPSSRCVTQSTGPNPISQCPPFFLKHFYVVVHMLISICVVGWIISFTDIMTYMDTVPQQFADGHLGAAESRRLSVRSVRLQSDPIGYRTHSGRCGRYRALGILSVLGRPLLLLASGLRHRSSG